MLPILLLSILFYSLIINLTFLQIEFHLLDFKIESVFHLFTSLWILP